MAGRVSDGKQHRSKWVDCFRTAALLARSKGATYMPADGSPTEDATAWEEIADYFDRKAKGGRGFLSMSPIKNAELSASAGRRAHAIGGAHAFTSATARDAGIVGGRAVSADRQHMAKIGRRGARVRAAKLARRNRQPPTQTDADHT